MRVTGHFEKVKLLQHSVRKRDLSAGRDAPMMNSLGKYLSGTMQHTLRASVTFNGVGLHSGQNVRMTINPAEPGTGIRFVRTDVAADNVIEARYSGVDAGKSNLCTYLANEHGVAVQTIEHVMAALAGCGIDNASIDINGPEVPLMDGSSVVFVRAINGAGRSLQAASRKIIRIVKPVSIHDGDRMAALLPQDGAPVFDFTVEFPGIGRQTARLTLDDASVFAERIAPARTFTMRSVAEMLKEKGLVKGATLDNAVVYEDTTGQPVEGTALRFDNEAARHKLLDAVGDLALAGMPIAARYVSVKGGHALTNRLLHTLFANPDSFEIVDDWGGIRLPDNGKAAIQPITHAFA